MLSIYCGSNVLQLCGEKGLARDTYGSWNSRSWGVLRFNSGSRGNLPRHCLGPNSLEGLPEGCVWKIQPPSLMKLQNLVRRHFTPPPPPLRGKNTCSPPLPQTSGTFWAIMFIAWVPLWILPLTPQTGESACLSKFDLLYIPGEIYIQPLT